MAARRRELGQQIEHPLGAIAGGGLHASRALRQRLQAAEQEIAAPNGVQARSPRLLRPYGFDFLANHKVQEW
jgi:hypothetical protein